MRSRIVGALSILVASWACTAWERPRSESFVFFHVIPTERAQIWSRTGRLRADLEVADAAGLAATLDPALVLKVDPENVEIDLSRYAGGRPTRRDDYLSPTFLVDFDDEAVSQWSRGLLERMGATPTPAQLVAAVRAAITSSMTGGILTASQVLRRGSGDCTEYAVLFAALARASTIPTRVVDGVVLVASGENEVQAFGHAWNEIFRDDAWQLVDSTPILGGRVVAYVPVDVFEDEGPGYTMATMKSLDRRPRAVRWRGRVPDPVRGAADPSP